MTAPFRIFAGVSGAKEAMSAFDALGASATRSVLRKALKVAAEPIAADARALAPRSGEGTDSTRRLADSILVTTRLSKSLRRKEFKRRGRQGNRAVVYVGSSAPHAHLLEFGHMLVKGSKKKGNRRVIGFVAARPFLRPAYDKNRDQVTKRFSAALWPELEKVARRLARQARRGRLGKKSLANLQSAAGR